MVLSYSFTLYSYHNLVLVLKTELVKIPTKFASLYLSLTLIISTCWEYALDLEYLLRLRIKSS